MSKNVTGHRLQVTGKIIFFVFFSFLLTNSFAQTQASAKIPAQTSSEYKQDARYVWDFGRANQGDVLKHTFSLKNESKNTLNIKNVTTSCGCTASKVVKTTLKPKESTELEVKFNSKGYSGHVEKFIYVNTDQLDNPVIRFIIKADVVKQN